MLQSKSSDQLTNSCFRSCEPAIIQPLKRRFGRTAGKSGRIFCCFLSSLRSPVVSSPFVEEQAVILPNFHQFAISRVFPCNCRVMQVPVPRCSGARKPAILWWFPAPGLTLDWVAGNSMQSARERAAASALLLFFPSLDCWARRAKELPGTLCPVMVANARRVPARNPWGRALLPPWCPQGCHV